MADIKKIFADKHNPEHNNYNSGRVKLQCLINGNCPVTYKQAQDESIVINNETVKSFPRHTLQSVSSIPGLQGVALKEVYEFRSNFISDASGVVKQDLVKLSNIAPYQYKLHQSFLTGSIFYPDDQNTKLKYFRENAPLPKRSSTEVEAANKELVNQAEIRRNTNEASDGNVLFIGDDDSEKTCWAARKVMPLFAGEDFFVCFSPINLSTNAKNLQGASTKPLCTKYFPYLDVSADWVAGKVDTNGNAVPPINQAIVSYTPEIVNGKIVAYKKSAEDSPYDLSAQAFYVIEMGPNPADNSIITLLITQKSGCIAILVKDGSSYNLGTYNNSIDMFGVSRDIVIVKNYLGRIVVHIGAESSTPWFISHPGPIVPGFKNIDGLLVVPPASITIAGGNVAAKFNFSPLTYRKSTSITFPPAPKDKHQTANDSYELPLTGMSKGYVWLSSNTQVQDYGVIYQSDAQYMEEVSIGLSGGVNVSSVPTPIPSYYLTSGRYIKAGSAYDNVVNEVDPLVSSKIKLSVSKPVINTEVTWGQEVIQFNVNASLEAGSHTFEDGFVLESCKTPILTGFRIVGVPDLSKRAWTTTAVDVSRLVLKYSENYSSSDYHTFTHTGSIVFNVNWGIPDCDDLIGYVVGLAGRAFYIEVWAYYEGGSDNCNYSKLTDTNGYKLFTGLCFGGVLNESPGQNTITCSIVDYSKILQDSYIFNSPFFDGMRDFNAISHMCKMVGLAGYASGGPAWMVDYMSTSGGPEVTIVSPMDGRMSYSTMYVLPSSYNRLKEAFYKFPDGKSFWEAMSEIAKKAAKAIYFDAYGVLHYENNPSERFLWGGLNDADIKAHWYFTSSPSGVGQLVFDTRTRERDVGSVFNIIHLVTSTPQYEYLINDRVNWRSVYKTDDPGFLGYKKLYYQQDGIFSNAEALENLSSYYARNLFQAPVIYKFQTYGLPMQPFDIVEFDAADGEQKQHLMITSISSEIDPKNNKWWSNVEAEWYIRRELV